MAIIAISRQMGSGGYGIAASVAKALGYSYADRQMIVEAAKDYEVPEAAIADVAEHRLAGWQRFDEEKLRYRTFLEAAYFGLAEQDNIVTAGRGIATLLRGVSHALRVRIVARLEVRVERTMEREHLGRSEALHKVREYDRDMIARIGYLFGPEWALPESYDLVINAARDDMRLYVDMIVAAATHPVFRSTPESLQIVRNLSLAAHVRAAIAGNVHIQRGANVEVTADKGHVSLRGWVRHPAVKDAVLTTVKGVPGVVSVSGEEVTLASWHLPPV